MRNEIFEFDMDDRVQLPIIPPLERPGSDEIHPESPKLVFKDGSEASEQMAEAFEYLKLKPEEIQVFAEVFGSSEECEEALKSLGDEKPDIKLSKVKNLWDDLRNPDLVEQQV